MPTTSKHLAEMPSSPKQFVPVVEEVKWERTTTESRISTVIGMLPTSLQSRMGPLRTFRRTASLGNISLSEEMTNSARALSRPRPLSAVGMPTALVQDVGEQDDVESVGSSGVKDRELVAAASSSTVSGVNWKLAQQGSGLVGIAADASQDEQSKDLERKAYLDGLTYLLRGLPANLEPVEISQLQSALPSTCRASNNAFRSCSGSMTPDSGLDLPRSFIHRLVQMLVVNLLLFIHFILPYAIMMLKSAATLERKYKVSETLVGHGMTFFNAVGRRGTHIVEVVLSAADGRSKEGAQGVATWLLEEVTRGVSDGLGEGLFMVRYKETA